jgi:pimeloyl-ACP methyl ester carboxylesterase
VPEHRTLDFEGCHFAWRLEGTGPPLLMIMGVGASGLGANPVVDILRSHYTCLTFDNRGMGASQPAARSLTVPQMARDTRAIMDAAGWDTAHILGHSLGGLIALQLALDARARVRSLSLLCTFASGRGATRLDLKLLWILARIRFGTRHMREDAFRELVLAPDKTHPEDVDRRLVSVLGHELGDIPEITSAQLEAMRHHDVSHRLGELSGIPTLVISGDRDLIARPELGRAIAAGIRGARYVEIPGASHALPILEAPQCAALLLEFLPTVDRK